MWIQFSSLKLFVNRRLKNDDKIFKSEIAERKPGLKYRRTNQLVFCFFWHPWHIMRERWKMRPAIKRYIHSQEKKIEIVGEAGGMTPVTYSLYSSDVFLHFTFFKNHFKFRPLIPNILNYHLAFENFKWLGLYMRGRLNVINRLTYLYMIFKLYQKHIYVSFAYYYTIKN